MNIGVKAIATLPATRGYLLQSAVHKHEQKRDQKGTATATHELVRSVCSLGWAEI